MKTAYVTFEAGADRDIDRLSLMFDSALPCFQGGSVIELCGGTKSIDEAVVVYRMKPSSWDYLFVTYEEHRKTCTAPECTWCTD